MEKLPKTVTHKELMLVYGLDKIAALRKLTVIRAVLGKKRYQLVHVAEFCHAENIDQEIFNAELKRCYTSSNSH